MTQIKFIAGLVVSFILFFIVLSYLDKMRRLYKIRKRLLYNYGRFRELDYSDEVLSVIGEYTRSKESMIDEITWNDLDLDSLFLTVNHTWSFAGEDYLYYLLHVPKIDSEKWKEQE